MRSAAVVPKKPHHSRNLLLGARPDRHRGRAPGLFDLSEHRFHHLLSQSVGRFEAAVVDLFSHQLRQRSTNLAVRRRRVLGPSGCDITVDTTGYERFEIGFAAVAGVREACSGLRPRLFSIAATKGTNWP